MLATQLPNEAALFDRYRLAAYDEMFEGAAARGPITARFANGS